MKIWFCFHYKESTFDYRVDDIDKLQLLDVLRELAEVALKQQVLIPEVYDLYHKKGYGGGKRYIRQDSNLMALLDGCVPEDTFDIWVEETKNPMPLFMLAKELNRQAELKEKDEAEWLRRKREEEAERIKREREAEEERIRREMEEEEERHRVKADVQPIAIEVPVVDVETKTQTYVRVTPDFPDLFEWDEYYDVHDSSQPQTQRTEDDNAAGSSEPKRTYTPIYSPVISDDESEESVPNSPIYTQNPDETSDHNPSIPEPEPFNTDHIHCNVHDQQEPHEHTPESTPHASQTFTSFARPYIPANKNQPRGGKVPKSTAKKQGTYVSKTRMDRSTAGTSQGRPVRSCGSRPIAHEDDDPLLVSDDDSIDSDFESYSDSSEFSDDDESDDPLSEDELVGNDEPIRRHPFDHIVRGDMNVDGVKVAAADKPYTNGRLYVEQPYGSIVLEPWLIFVNKEAFLKVLKNYVIHSGFALVVIKSDNKRYTAECRDEACDWRIHSSLLPDKTSWQIKGITGGHKCMRLRHNPMADSDWLVDKVMSDVRANPAINAKSLKEICSERLFINVKKRLLHKIRKLAVEKLLGRHDESYNLLPGYAEMIKMTNPGSYPLITWHQPHGPKETRFKAAFITFKAWIKGFLSGCRPIIGVDGTALKGTYKGVLLSAISLDANNNLFLVAYAIVSKENSETWSYFFRNLRSAFQQQGCIQWDWTFISDRMSGVENSLSTEFPKCTRRVCAQHLYENWRKQWGSPAMYNVFWEAAKATNKCDYDRIMKKMAALDPAAVRWLNDIPYQWAVHTFETSVCCDQNTSNFVESFNSLILEMRALPVYRLMEAIRANFMEKFADRYEAAELLGDNDATPWAKNCVEAATEQSRTCRVIKGGDGRFEVRDGPIHNAVDITHGTCACGSWQITGIPCRHACAAILFNKEQPLHYVHGFFTGLCYKLTYSIHMHTVPNNSQWPEFPQFPTLLPPLVQRAAGRPIRKRRRNDKGKKKRVTTMRCSTCKTVGHNARGCQGGPTAKEKKAAAMGKSGAASASSRKKKGTSEAQNQGKKRKADDAGTSSKKRSKTN